MPDPEPAGDGAEIVALRARVAELEAELAEQTRRTNAVVARAQEELYWLERWHVDINRLMTKRSAQSALAALKGARGVSRGVRKARRRLRSSS